MAVAADDEVFTEFVQRAQPRFNVALTAAYGPEGGHDATAAALEYAWRHWERVVAMANPTGYLYRVGQSRARRYLVWSRRKTVPLTSGAGLQSRTVGGTGPAPRAGKADAASTGRGGTGVRLPVDPSQGRRSARGFAHDGGTTPATRLGSAAARTEGVGTTDLEQQIRDYHETIIDPVDVEEVTAAAPTTLRNGPRRWRGWVAPAAFAAAFFLTLATLGIAAFVLRDDGTGVLDDSLPPSTITQGTAELPLDSLSWSRLPHDEGTFNPATKQQLNSVTTGGPGFVAVGGETKNAGTAEDNAAVWTSTDGIAWTQVTHNEEAFGGVGARMMEDVTAGGPGLVAVGLRFDEPGKRGLNAAVWTSVDGITWSAVPHSQVSPDSHDPDEFGNGKTWMHSVTAGGPGLIAVGADAWSAAVWTSVDGISWTRVPHDPDVFGHARSWETNSAMYEIVDVGSGLVAVGDLDGRGTVWTSPDGVTWSAFSNGLDINGVTAGPSGLVAVGGYEMTEIGCHAGEPGDCHAVVWTSPDGATWTQVPDDAAVFGDTVDKQMMSAVTAVGSDLVAVGTTVWTSPDGINWLRVFHDTSLSGAEQTGMRSLAVGAHEMVAVGDVDDKPNIWIATPED